MTIVYAEEPDLPAPEFLDVLGRSASPNGPTSADAVRAQTVLAGSDLIVAARDGAADGKLVGVARCVTDQATACLCIDLAVDSGYETQGLARKLLESTRGLLPGECRLYLVAEPGRAAAYDAMALAPVDGVFEVPAGG